METLWKLTALRSSNLRRRDAFCPAYGNSISISRARSVWRLGCVNVRPVATKTCVGDT
jgi:hypothetical protein